MRTIYRYQFKMDTREETFLAPFGAKFLHFGARKGDLSIWFEVEDSGFFQERTFALYLTGQEVEPGFQHLGTYVASVKYIWHLYEKVGP